MPITDPVCALSTISRIDLYFMLSLDRAPLISPIIKELSAAGAIDIASLPISYTESILCSLQAICHSLTVVSDDAVA